VRRAWRGRGLAAYLKRRTLHWAATHDIQEVYTWTQAHNEAMIRLNRHLGYVDGAVSITVSRPLPLSP
jgi:GNAT superfamily N-acetyltransferase